MSQSATHVGVQNKKYVPDKEKHASCASYEVSHDMQLGTPEPVLVSK